MNKLHYFTQKSHGIIELKLIVSTGEVSIESETC